MAQLKRKVHSSLWSDCRNKDVFSDRLNREYGNSAFRKSAGKLFHALVARAKYSHVSYVTG